ncbi:MAG: glycosyltransferase family 1 protein, partial [Polyangiaceae bacterium]
MTSTSRPRLLLDLTPLDTPARARGIGRYIRDLALGLSALPPAELGGLEILGLTALGWSGNYTLTEDIASYTGNPELPRPTESDYYRWAYRQRIALWRAATRANAGAVHLCDAHATPLLLGLTSCRRIVTCHDLVPSRFPERYMGARDGGAFIGKSIEKRRYFSADLVVAISDATRADVLSLLGVPEQRVVRVHNGVDIARWATEPTASSAATLARLGVQRDFVLYVGGSDWRKNTEGMMAGLAHARDQGLDLELVWAGSLDEGHIAAVTAEAHRFGVSDAVRRLGYVSDDDLSVLYRAARAHLFVSRYEGFGLTVIEAMAAGCPVITTMDGSLGEVAGDAAATVNAEDHAAIGQAIVALCRDASRRAELVGRGRERARLFSLEAQAKAMARA